MLILSLQRLSRNVAIKIFRSAFRSGDHILTNFERLRSGPDSHPGKKLVAHLLDSFDLRGPNSNHLCLVSSALGEPVSENIRSPKGAWESAKQLVQATAYAHEVGVVHGGE